MNVGSVHHGAWYHHRHLLIDYCFCSCGSYCWHCSRCSRFSLPAIAEKALQLLKIDFAPGLCTCLRTYTHSIYVYPYICICICISWLLMYVYIYIYVNMYRGLHESCKAPLLILPLLPLLQLLLLMLSFQVWACSYALLLLLKGSWDVVT